MELPSLADKVCLVTGANSGIGRATSEGLARLGARVVMVARSRERGEAAQEAIIRETGNEDVDLLVADLASQGQIRHLAATFIAQYERLDVLVNNAAVILGKRELTDEGIEKTFAVNHLAYFLLTRLLLEVLQASAPARIVNVTSESHREADIDFDDLGGERSYDGIQAYNQSKLANVLFTYELARRLKGTGVTVNCVHPGMVATNIWRREAGWLPWLTSWFTWLLRSPEDGAEGPLYLAVSPEVAGVTGQYFNRTRQMPSSDRSYDERLAERLWAVSEEMTGL